MILPLRHTRKSRAMYMFKCANWPEFRIHFPIGSKMENLSGVD